MFQDKKIIVFGGTGTIGSEIVNQLLFYNPKVIRIFSNDENSIFESKNTFGDLINLRWILGDIRDKEKVYLALRGIDYVFNCAAIKHVGVAEYNPLETVMTNIIGVDNIIQACMKLKVQRYLQISTDKAVEPISVMGATKLIAERLCLSRSKIQNPLLFKIGCVRLGNVYGSRGSLVPMIKKWLDEGKTTIGITDFRMKRFFIGQKEVGKFIITTMEKFDNGEIHIPKMEEYLIKEIVQDVINKYREETGRITEHIKIFEHNVIKTGEKLRERLYLESEKVKNYSDRLVINNE